MPISSSLMLSLKVVLISTSILSGAVMLKLYVPSTTDFASIYYGFVSWLRPPYLYLVINCIIITIVASSKLQSSKDVHVSSFHSPAFDTMVHVQPHPVMKNIIQADYSNYDVVEYKQNAVVESQDVTAGGYDVKVEKGLDASVAENETAFSVNVASTTSFEEEDETMSNKENEFVILKSTWTPPPPENKEKSLTFSNEKPPAAARFGHRRNVKASPEGCKTVLRVSRPKRQDTLESTWKTITEGRAMPISRHLRKSETWELDHTHGGGCRVNQVQDKTPKKMIKSETFNDRTNTSSSLLTPSPGSSGTSKLKKEPSLSQDELNKRVEAFIKKFNEEMRLQRQESLNQYMEMINRGSH